MTTTCIPTYRMPSPRHPKFAAAVSSQQANKRRRQAPATPSAASGSAASASTFPSSSSVAHAAAPSSSSSSSSTALSAAVTIPSDPSFDASMSYATAATRRGSAMTASSAAFASSSSRSSASTPAARGAPATGYIDLTSELSDENELEEETGDEEVQFMGITPGTRQAIRSSDMLLRGLFPAPPVRHRAEGGNGGGELVAASSGSLPRDMMFTEGLAPLFSHANNLIRLILSHRPMPVVNRGATNAQIARLPTHTLPRTTTSGVRRGKGTGRKRKAPGEVPVPSNAESENADVKAMAVGQHNASSSSSSRGCVAAAATSGDDPNLNMPDRSSVAATAAEGGLDACTICMEDYKGGEKLCTLPCSHVYHFKCCKKWLKTNNICCICRASIDSGSP